MRTLSGEADRLTETHPEQADDIRAKQAEIGQNWEHLKAKVSSYKFRVWLKYKFAVLNNKVYIKDLKFELKFE